MLFRSAHALLAQDVGISEENIFICENGESLELSETGVKRGEIVQSGVVFVDGLSVGDTSQDVLDERIVLGAQGFAARAVAVDFANKRIVGTPMIEMHGITGGDDELVAEDVQQLVESALTKQIAKGANAQELKKAGRDAMLSLLWERTKQRPMAVASIIDVTL